METLKDIVKTSAETEVTARTEIPFPPGIHISPKILRRARNVGGDLAWTQRRLFGHKSILSRRRSVWPIEFEKYTLHVWILEKLAFQSLVYL